MDISTSRRRTVGVSAVLGLGVSLLAVHILHATAGLENLRTFVYGILVPIGFVLVIVAGGVWLWRGDLEGDDVARIAAWCVAASAVTALGAVVLVRYQHLEGARLSHAEYLVASAASSGGMTGFVMGVYDVRQRVARAEAERASKQLTVINRVLRHDIRHAANAIQGHADLLAEDGDGERHRRAIRRQADELVELGEQARTIEEVVTGEEDDRRPVDLVALLEEHADRIRRQHPDLEVETDLPGEQTVAAHPLLDAAVGNLLENAVEHNDEDAPAVRIECSNGEHAGQGSVELRIADNGTGIPKEEIAVLERGYETQLEHTSGLGLWLVHWIVTASGGDVRYETGGEGGSSVCLRLQAN